jgi:hypothetical protein
MLMVAGGICYTCKMREDRRRDEDIPCNSGTERRRTTPIGARLATQQA